MLEKYYLRDICSSDIKTIHTWRNDAEIVAGLGASYRYVNLQTEETWFATYQSNRSTQVRLGIINKQDDHLIGMSNLVKIDSLARSAEFSLQIGDKEFWGIGVGKWATKFTIMHGFNNLNLNRIYLYVLADNIPAQAVYRAVGFLREGVLREAVFKEGKYKDLIVMSVLRQEFNCIE
ncbi:MAG: GNAT family N-acetyltransferase [Methylomarinum sp.]|nr:GNAT family N-acetyltransferase [Methylomarinum sp.]